MPWVYICICMHIHILSFRAYLNGGTCCLQGCRRGPEHWNHHCNKHSNYHCNNTEVYDAHTHRLPILTPRIQHTDMEKPRSDCSRCHKSLMSSQYHASTQTKQACTYHFAYTYEKECLRESAGRTLIKVADQVTIITCYSLIKVVDQVTIITCCSLIKVADQVTIITCCSQYLWWSKVRSKGYDPDLCKGA